MKYLLIIAILTSPLFATACDLPDPPERQEKSAEPFELSSLEWKNRVILLFAAGPRDLVYRKQQEALSQATKGMQDRDLVVVAAFADGSGMLDGRPIDKRSVRAIRRDFQPRPGAFTFVLVGKDGTEKKRVEGKPAKVEEVFALIDSMPMRKQEMKDQAETGK